MLKTTLNFRLLSSNISNERNCLYPPEIPNRCIPCWYQNWTSVQNGIHFVGGGFFDSEISIISQPNLIVVCLSFTKRTWNHPKIGKLSNNPFNDHHLDPSNQITTILRPKKRWNRSPSDATIRLLSIGYINSTPNLKNIQENLLSHFGCWILLITGHSTLI